MNLRDAITECGGGLDNDLTILQDLAVATDAELCDKLLLKFVRKCDPYLEESLEKHLIVNDEFGKVTQVERDNMQKFFYQTLWVRWWPSMIALVECVCDSRLSLGTRPILHSTALMSASMQEAAECRPPVEFNESSNSNVDSTKIEFSEWFKEGGETASNKRFNELLETSKFVLIKRGVQDSDADDLAMEVMTKISMLPDAPENLDAYLRQSLKNRNASEHRKKGKTLTMSPDCIEESSNKKAIGWPELVDEFDASRDEEKAPAVLLDGLRKVLGRSDAVAASLYVAFKVEGLKPSAACECVFHRHGDAALSTRKPSHRTQDVRKRFESKLDAYLKGRKS